MVRYQALLNTALRFAVVPAVVALSACQSMGAGSDQQAFVAAHIAKTDAPLASGSVYVGHDAAFARLEPQSAGYAGSRQ